MAGHNHLGYGAHAHSIAANAPEVAVLGRCLERRTLCTHIHAFHQADAFLLGDVTGHLDQAGTVGINHGRETRTQFVDVLAVQRVFGEHVDVVGDDHQVAHLEVRVHAA